MVERGVQPAGTEGDGRAGIGVEDLGRGDQALGGRPLGHERRRPGRQHGHEDNDEHRQGNGHERSS